MLSERNALSAAPVRHITRRSAVAAPGAPAMGVHGRWRFRGAIIGSLVDGGGVLFASIAVAIAALIRRTCRLLCFTVGCLAAIVEARVLFAVYCCAYMS